MNTQQRDPLFESLDRLAGLADNDVVGDRMPEIRQRVRVARRRRVAVVAAAAAVLAVVGVGVWKATPAQRTDPPIVTQDEPRQEIAINAEARGSTIRISFTVSGQSTAYTDPETGEPLEYAGPESTEVSVDGASGSGEGATPLSCEPGGKLTSYSLDYHVSDPVVVRVSPGEHTVVVKAPYCSDGKVVPSTETMTVTTGTAGMTTTERSRADLDGDGTAEVLKLKTPRDPTAENQVLEVTWGTGETSVADLSNTMTYGLVDPVDLDGDGDLEVIVYGGGGETALYWVYQADTDGLHQVDTVDSDGSDLPLSSAGGDPTGWQVYAGPEGIRTYRLQDPTTTDFPAPVDVRDWSLVANTLTRSPTTGTACVTFQPVLILGPC